MGEGKGRRRKERDQGEVELRRREEEMGWEREGEEGDEQPHISPSPGSPPPLSIQYITMKICILTQYWPSFMSVLPFKFL